MDLNDKDDIYNFNKYINKEIKSFFRKNKYIIF